LNEIAPPRQLNRYPASLFEKQIKPARGRLFGYRARRAAWLLGFA